jgi:hypothetical protein
MAEDDAVYSVAFGRRPSPWRRVLDVILDMFFLAGGVDSVMDALSGPWYLVANESRGVFVRVEKGVISDTIPVPGWNPLWKDNFKRIVIGSAQYKKIQKLA